MVSQFAQLPEAEAIVAGDLERTLPNDVREVLLNVILAWANLDMATAFFLASVSELTPDEGAEKFGRKEIAEKLKRSSMALQAQGKEDVASKVRAIADEYPDKALLRRRIAHSKCAGVRKSLPSRIIFMPFEREGPPEHLAVEVIDVATFAEATKWANEIHDYLMQRVDDVSFFGIR